MYLDDLILISKKEPVVKNGLLLEGQVAYNLGLNEIIGPQKKVVYNAMGPDVSTVLYLTDADEIIGIEKEKFRTRKFLGLIKNNFDNIEIEIGREDCINPIIRFNSQNEAKVRYLSCLESRKNWGYWDYGSIDLWGRERLMVFELKIVGIKSKRHKYNR